MIPISKLNYLFTLCVAFFLITSARAQTCQGTLGDPVVNVTFGTGTGTTTFANAAPGATTTYTSANQTCPNDGSYAVSNVTNGCFGSSWHALTEDHTLNDVNGRFVIINAANDPGEFYKQTVNGLCGNTTYELASFVGNLLKPGICGATAVQPNLKFQVESLSGTVLGTYTTGIIPPTSAFTWQQYGFVFRTPFNTSDVVLKIINMSPGGCGNDLALDDITFRPCGPMVSTTASVAAICAGGSAVLNGTVSAGYDSPVYQWQQSSNGGTVWTDISGANTLSYTVNNGVGGIKYRLLVAETGNLGIATCRIASNAVALAINFGPEPSTPPANTDVCAGAVVDLPDFTSNPTATYNWTANDLTLGLTQGSGTGQIPVFTSAGNGTINFSVTSTLNGCTSAAKLFSLRINPRPIGAITPAGNQSICRGSSVTFTASATNGTPAYTYSWNNALGTNPVQTVGPTATTTYTVTVTDSRSCTATASTTVTVNALPTLTSLTATNARCRGQASGTITAVGSGAATLQYSLDGINFQNSGVFNSQPAGNYTVTVRDGNGCRATGAIVVGEPASQLVLATPTVVNPTCNGGTNGSITVSASGGTGGISYQRCLGSGCTNFGASQSSTFFPSLSQGIYRVQAVDANGCVAISNDVTVSQPALLTASASSNSPICEGATLNLLAATSAGAGITYAWTGPNSYTSSAQNPTRTNAISNMGGAYGLTVRDANGCTNSTSISVTVNPKPFPPNLSSSNVTICAGQSTSISQTGCSGTVTWSNGVSGVSSITVSPTTTTSYTATCTTTATGCVSDALNFVTITVNPKPAPPTLSASSGTI